MYYMHMRIVSIVAKILYFAMNVRTKNDLQLNCKQWFIVYILNSGLLFIV